MMKKRYAVMMTAAVLTGVMTAAAMAEGLSVDSGMQMSGPQMPGGGEMGQAPEMNGEAPQMGENGQAPEMNGEAPADNFGFISFENYVADGTISQETYEAITKFMEENKPELPEGMTEGERPELPEGAAEGERPELPEGVVEGERPELPEGVTEGERPALPNGEMPEMKEGEGPDLLKDLLEAGVITQEEYDALAAAREAARPAAPAANQNTENTQNQTADETTGA